MGNTHDETMRLLHVMQGQQALLRDQFNAIESLKVSALAQSAAINTLILTHANPQQALEIFSNHLDMTHEDGLTPEFMKALRDELQRLQRKFVSAASNQSLS